MINKTLKDLTVTLQFEDLVTIASTSDDLLPLRYEDKFFGELEKESSKAWGATFRDRLIEHKRLYPKFGVNVRSWHEADYRFILKSSVINNPISSMPL